MSAPVVPLQSGRLILANVQKTIYSWLRIQTKDVIPSNQILWRNQSEPLPPRPCVTMKIISGPKRTGYQDNMVAIPGGSGSLFNVGGQRTMMVSIQVFGSTQVKAPFAYQLATDLNASLSLQTVLDLLRGGGISVYEQGEVLNLTALEETEYEERAGFDVLFGLAENIMDDPGIITTVGAIGSTINPPT